MIILKCVKRSLCNSRCAIGIRDAEAFNKIYIWAHCVIGIVNFFVKRSLCNSLCAIGIRDAENFKKGYMAHAVPLVVVANLFIKSSNISVCAMSRLSLVSFSVSVDRGATGIVTK